MSDSQNLGRQSQPSSGINGAEAPWGIERFMAESSTASPWHAAGLVAGTTQDKQMTTNSVPTAGHAASNAATQGSAR